MKRLIGGGAIEKIGDLYQSKAILGDAFWDTGRKIICTWTKREHAVTGTFDVANCNPNKKYVPSS